MSLFKLHSKKQKDKPQDNGAFFEWATEQNLFFDKVHPWERTQRFLVEIQKRLLAEQVFIVSRDNSDNRLKIVKIAPHKEKPAISASLINKIMCKQEGGNALLYWDDFWEDPSLREDLNDLKINSIISSVITTQPETTDHLFIINYVLSTDIFRVNDYLYGLSAVLAQSVLNSRLHDELNKKDRKLQKWASQVEQRIEKGTKTLLEQEFQFHALFEGANDGIIVHDESGDIIEANGVICRLLGYSRSELIQMSWDYIVPSSDRGQLQSIFSNVLVKKHVSPFESKFRKKDSTVFDVEISSRRVWFKGKEVIQSFIRDISLRLKMKHTLVEAKEKYRMLVEFSLNGVFNIRGDKFLFVNKMFEQITGYSKDELLSMDWYSLFPDEEQDRVREIEMSLPEKHAPGEFKDFETNIVRKDGRKIICEIRSTIIEMDGRPTILGNINEITQRKELASKLLEAKKMESIGTLAGGIAHDFNNLLGGILGYSSLMLSDMEESNQYYDDISTIAETTKRAAELTNRLLAFARGGKYQVKEVIINDIVSEVTQILEQTAGKDISLGTSLDPEIWKIRGDREQIHKAILNVCLNGIEAFSSEHGKINIDSANVTLNCNFSQKVLGLPAGDYIRVAISDTGFGMSESVKSRMFEPFFTTKTYGEGAGLGLAMVYGVIKNHDGSILVDTAPGKGTTVSIFLPKYSEVKKGQKNNLKSKRELHNRILLIDDERIIREVGQRMLEKAGFEVLTASNGASGVKIFLEDNKTIDLVLLDWMMPGMGGNITSKRIKEINPDVPVCFLSGYRPCDKPEMMELADQCFIQKPFQPDVLLSAVNNILQIADHS